MQVNIISIQIFCSRLLSVSWLQDHLLPCPFKYLTGIDCPGCGFQRSVIALIQGNLYKSLQLYPAAIPLMLFFAYGIADKYLKLDTATNVVKKTVFVALGLFILASYSIKLLHLYQSYKVSALAAM
ncbi:MAG: DUF2752 domain-containing protein [Bacteroidota bacterium]|nr:DUF2752 domain-containing protein [Bacteroidota bacterium]